MVIGHRCHGHGPEKVLVLPGLPGDHSNYEAALPGLDAEAYSFAFVDYRGVGLSRDISGDYTLGEIVSDVRDVTRSMVWDRFHVIGHSFGGFIAQRLAVELPLQIQSVLAVAPVPGNGHPADAAGRAVGLAATEGDDEALLAIIRAFAAGRLPEAWTRWFRAYTRSIVTREAYRAYFLLSCETDFSAALRGLPVPFGVLLGNDDPFFTRELMDKTLCQWLRNITVESLACCSHWPMLEVPLHFAASVERFLRSVA